MSYQNFYAQKLDADIDASATSIAVTVPPSATSGRMTIEARNVSQREIIRYTGVAGNTLTGVLRGQGGTIARSHDKNSLIEMNVTAEDLQEALGVPSDVVTRTVELYGDVIASGCVWTKTAGLNASMSAGVAYINGIRTVIASIASKTFAISTDTYIYLDPIGTVGYTAQSLGTQPPASTSSLFYFAKVTTDGTAITDVSPLPRPGRHSIHRHYSTDQGEVISSVAFANLGFDRTRYINGLTLAGSAVQFTRSSWYTFTIGAYIKDVASSYRFRFVMSLPNGVPVAVAQMPLTAAPVGDRLTTSATIFVPAGSSAAPQANRGANNSRVGSQGADTIVYDSFFSIVEQP